VYYALSAITGMIIAVMIMINGMLSNHSGLYTSTVIIHVTGLILISAINRYTRESKKVFRYKLPFYLYTGGIIGVLTIVFNNMAFSKIDLSAMLALTLFGQSVTSLVIDHYGWFGMKQVRFSPKKLVGILAVLCGIICMISVRDLSQIVPIIVSFLAGITIVISRTINGKLAVETSVRISTWYNYFTGTIVSLILLFFISKTGNEPPLALAYNPLIYTGGIIGMCAVFITNICVSKISSFYMTLLLFAGQIFAGIGIDIVLSHSFSIRNLIGGIIITVGLTLDMSINRRGTEKALQEG